MKGAIPLLTLTVAATTALTEDRFVAHDGSLASAAGNTLGVATMSVDIGDNNSVVVLGTAQVVSGEALPAGSNIEVGADGKANVLAAGKLVAKLQQGEVATAADQLVTVLLIQNA